MDRFARASWPLGRGSACRHVRAYCLLLDSTGGPPMTIAPHAVSGTQSPEGRAANERARMMNTVGALLLALPLLAGTAGAVTIGCDGSAGQCLQSPLATFLVDFTLDAPQIVRIAAGDSGGSSPSEPRWRVVDTFAQPAADCGDWQAGSYSDPSVSDRDCALPAGSYRIQVEDRDQDETGCFNVN